MSELYGTLPISVVIPAYRRPGLTVRAVRSALGQLPLPPDEVIVVDDASGDGTADAAREAGARVLVHEVNLGEAATRNTGIAAANNPWVALLDSDDEWMPEHLENAWPHTQDAVLVSAAGLQTGGDRAGRLWGIGGTSPVRFNTPAALVAPGNSVTVSAALLRRDLAIAVGGFQGEGLCVDFDLWLRMVEQGPVVLLPQATVRYSVHDGQMSTDREAMREAHRAVSASYHGRPWWSRALMARLGGAQDWDDLRTRLRRGDRLGAMRIALRLASDPRRARGAVDLLRWRRRLRRTPAMLTLESRDG